MPHHPSSMVQNTTVDDVVVTHATPNGKAVGKPAADMENNFKPRLAHDLSDSNVIRTDDILASEDVEFKNLMLPDFILCGLTAANFHRPSPIQLRSIPLLRLGLGKFQIEFLMKWLVLYLSQDNYWFLFLF